MSTSSPFRTDVGNLLRIAVPISLGSLVQFLVVFTDNFFLSRAGEMAINGAGNAGLVYLTFTMVIMGGSVGIQILVARFKGQGQPQQMAQAFGRDACAGALGVLLAPSCWASTRSAVGSCCSPTPTCKRCSSRSWAFGLGVVAVCLADGCGSRLDWPSQTRPILVLALLMASTNVVLDAMWVEGWWGGQAMGARGAAYASLVAESVGAVCAWFWASRRTHPEAFMGRAPRNKAMERQWWRLSAPVMGQFGMTIATWASFFFFVERVGMMELKVSHLTRNAFMLAFVICSGWAKPRAQSSAP